MSQSPYANLSGDFLETQPTRTSVLSILSLILGIVGVVPCVCAAPGSGAVAVILGGAALMFIGRESGRLRGSGLAASGIVLGLLVSIIQVVMLVVAFRMHTGYKQVASLSESAMVAMQKGDFAAARTSFPATTDSVLTDQMMKDFVAAYQAELGNYQGFPEGPWSVIRDWMTAGPAMAALQNSNKGQPPNDLLPFPGRFDRGVAVIGIRFNQRAIGGTQPTPTSGMVIPPSNLVVLTVSGKAIWLIDPESDAGKAIKAAENAGGSTPPPPPIQVTPQPAPTPPAALPSPSDGAPEKPETP